MKSRRSKTCKHTVKVCNGLENVLQLHQKAQSMKALDKRQICRVVHARLLDTNQVDIRGTEMYRALSFFLLVFCLL